MSAAGPRRWVSRTPTTLDVCLAGMRLTAGEIDEAIADGRVFVGKRRAIDRASPVAAGVEVWVHPPRPTVALPEPFVLFEDESMIAVAKPAGVPSVPDLVGVAGSLQELVARRSGIAASALVATSRLDADVSGVVTFAKSAAAADRLSKLRADGAYHRRYVAIAAGMLDGDSHVFSWSIGRHRDARLRTALPEGHGGDAKPAKSLARVVARIAEAATVDRAPAMWLALTPITGRTHQLRVHAAAAGAPLFGDRAYGGPHRVVSPRGSVTSLDRIYLHCAEVRLGLGAAARVLTAGLPEGFAVLATQLGLIDAPSSIDRLWEDSLRCDR